MKRASKRMLSFVLCVCLIFSLIPCALAADGDGGFTISYSFDKSSYEKDDIIKATVVLTRDTDEPYKLRGFTFDIRSWDLNLEYVEKPVEECDPMDSSIRIASGVGMLAGTTDTRLSLFHTYEDDFNICGKTTNIITLTFKAKEAGNTQLKTLTDSATLLIVGGDYKPNRPQGNISITTPGTPETKYTVSFANGGATGGTAPAAIADQKENDHFTIPACGYTWEHHNFKGWMDNTGSTKLWQPNDEYTMPSQNVVFTAQWEQYEYKAAFIGGDGTTGEPPEVRWYNPGEGRLLPTENTLKKTGYTFEGWKYNGTTYKTTFTMPANDVTLTADWKAIDTGGSSSGGGGGGSVSATYPINIIAPSGGTASSNKKTAASGETVTITVTPPTGSTIDSVTAADKNGKSITVSGGNGKYTFKMPASAVTVTVKYKQNNIDIVGDCPKDNTCPIDPFTDTENTKWWHDGIHYCLENGLMKGVSTNRFSPNGTTTRAMIVTILWRMENSPATSASMSFKDVPSGQWYTEAIRWAQSTGVVTGYNADMFGPNDNITREQLAAILYRYADSHKLDVTARNSLSQFTDAADISNWALENIKWANAAGLVSGRTAAQLAPKANATRAEAASMIQRFCENILHWQQ